MTNRNYSLTIKLVTDEEAAKIKAHLQKELLAHINEDLNANFTEADLKKIRLRLPKTAKLSVELRMSDKD